MVCVPDTPQDQCAELVESDSAVEGGAKVVEGVDFLNYLDRGGRERASDGPGEAGPLAAEDGGLVEDDNFALFICEEQAVVFKPGLGLLHKDEELSPR